MLCKYLKEKLVSSGSLFLKKKANKVVSFKYIQVKKSHSYLVLEMMRLHVIGGGIILLSILTYRGE